MMPQEPQGRPVFDLGNNLLGEQPAQIDLKKVPTPGGERLAFTLRTPSTTCTAFLTGKDAKTWARILTREAEGMSETKLVTGNGMVPG